MSDKLTKTELRLLISAMDIVALHFHLDMTLALFQDMVTLALILKHVNPARANQLARGPRTQPTVVYYWQHGQLYDSAEQLIEDLCYSLEQ